MEPIFPCFYIDSALGKCRSMLQKEEKLKKELKDVQEKMIGQEEDVEQDQNEKIKAEEPKEDKNLKEEKSDEVKKKSDERVAGAKVNVGEMKVKEGKEMKKTQKAEQKRSAEMGVKEVEKPKTSSAWLDYFM